MDCEPKYSERGSLPFFYTNFPPFLIDADFTRDLASSQRPDNVNSELLSLQTGRLHAIVKHHSNPSDPWQTIQNCYFGALHGANPLLTFKE